MGVGGISTREEYRHLVFKVKHDSDGNIIRFKAHLVVRGFSQAFGVDYFEMCAPVAKLTTYRTIFTVAVLEPGEIHGMDVITAFLLGKLDEEIYMAQPEEFMAKGMKSRMVCRLERKIWITIWVDDLLIAGKDGTEIARVKKQLAGEFEMKDLGDIKHFLGMSIARDTSNGSISIDQTAYIRSILERYGIEASKPVSMPLAAGARLVKAVDGNGDVDLKLYQGMIGSIMNAMLCTRPDIAFAVEQLSQYASKPTNAHVQAAKRVLRYLQGTQDVGLNFSKHKAEITTMQAHCDVDYGAGEDRKSISGYVFMLCQIRY